MAKKLVVAAAVACMALTGASPASADHNRYAGGRYHRTPTHAGEMDTDGILSQGELRNPRIDYDRAQRKRLRDGDYRVDNPYNDSAAEAARRKKYDDGRYSYRDHGRYDRDRYDRDGRRYWRDYH